MVAAGQQEKLVLHSASLPTREEGKQTHYRRKFAFASCSPDRANQPSEVCLSQGHTACSPPSLLPPPLPFLGMELSCPEPETESLLRHRTWGVLEGSRVLETPCQYLFQTGDIACSSCSMEAFWGALAAEEFRLKDGTTLAPPPPLGEFCQIGKAEGGVVPARGCGSIKSHLLANQ